MIGIRLILRLDSRGIGGSGLLIVDRRLFEGALLGFGTAARFDQSRFGEAFIIRFR